MEAKRLSTKGHEGPRRDTKKNKKSLLQKSAARRLPGMATKGTKTQIVTFVPFVVKQHFRQVAPDIEKGTTSVCRQPVFSWPAVQRLGGEGVFSLLEPEADGWLPLPDPLPEPED